MSIPFLFPDIVFRRVRKDPSFFRNLVDGQTTKDFLRSEAKAMEVRKKAAQKRRGSRWAQG